MCVCVCVFVYLYLPLENKNYILGNFCLEPTVHGMAYYELGYNVISHISNYELTTNIIPDLHDRNKNIIYKCFQDGKVSYIKDDFTTVCKQYFDKYLKEIVESELFSSLYAGESISSKKMIFESEFATLPYVNETRSDSTSILNSRSNTTMRTMRDWCRKNQMIGTVPGFVIYGRDLCIHSKFLNIENVMKSNHLSTPPKDLIVVYNQMQNLIFLIRKWSTKNLELGMRLSTVDIVQFKLLFHDVLIKSGVKLINLLATEEDVSCYPWKCDSCKYHVIPINSLVSSDAFSEWLDKSKSNFKISFFHSNVNKNFSFDFAAKVSGFLALLQYSKESHFFGVLPSLNEYEPTEQITETLLMTPQQLRIAYSSRKHMIIKGCYGSGKTTVARKRAEIISRSLTQDDSLYYIICDSISLLGKEMQLNTGIEVLCNDKQVPESALVEKILSSDSKKGKLNLIFDEFDGRNLDEIEAKKLNHEFKTNERLKDSNIIVIPQPLEEGRGVNDNHMKTNIFEKLETLNPPEELTYNMRNTLEIKRLIRVTISALEDPSSVYFKSVFFPLDQSKRTQDTDNQTEILAEEGIGEEYSLDAQKIKPDETYDSSRSSIGKSYANKVTGDKSEHLQSNKFCCKVKSEVPSLYEVFDTTDNTKLKIHLLAILQKVLSETEEGNQLDISHVRDLTDMQNMEKHVVLHFDENRSMPESFDTVFKLMGISKKITKNYDEFKRVSEKAIFSCNYRSFKGLEYPRVIVVLDCSLHFLKHSLPECLSRCTAVLHIIVLNQSHCLNSSRLHETLQKVIETWKRPVKGHQPLVQQWKIEIIDSDKSHNETSQLADSGTPEQGRIRIRSNVYEEIEQVIEERKPEERTFVKKERKKRRI